MVVSPEHEMLGELTTSEQADAVQAYCEKASFKSDRERTDGDRAKTGVFTGSHAINPVNGQPVPIWVADYVLAGYGTGAIMAVPAHDDRDFEFAKQFDLSVVPVVNPPDDHPSGMRFWLEMPALRPKAMRSTVGSSMAGDGVKTAVTAMLNEAGLAAVAVNYKLRDICSLGRFWGEPFPILHEIDEQGELTEMKRAVPDLNCP